MKIEIKSRWSGEVLFAHECKQNDMIKTLRAAFEAKADLRGANLHGADLYGADLGGADLCGANLYGADLGGADLCGANLCGANLRSADLRGANLHDANLYGANLRGANLRSANLCGADLGDANLYGADLRGADLGEEYGKLIGDRPYFSVGPIGSRNDYFSCWITDKGTWLRAGCFFGAIKDFQAKLVEEHGDNVHAEEYKDALKLIRKHVKLWGSE